MQELKWKNIYFKIFKNFYLFFSFFFHFLFEKIFKKYVFFFFYNEKNIYLKLFSIIIINLFFLLKIYFIYFIYFKFLINFILLYCVSFYKKSIIKRCFIYIYIYILVFKFYIQNWIYIKIFENKTKNEKIIQFNKIIQNLNTKNKFIFFKGLYNKIELKWFFWFYYYYYKFLFYFFFIELFIELKFIIINFMVPKYILFFFNIKILILNIKLKKNRIYYKFLYFLWRIKNKSWRRLYVDMQMKYHGFLYHARQNKYKFKAYLKYLKLRFRNYIYKSFDYFLYMYFKNGGHLIMYYFYKSIYVLISIFKFSKDYLKILLNSESLYLFLKIIFSRKKW